jgi:hypothetical protein
MPLVIISAINICGTMPTTVIKNPAKITGPVQTEQAKFVFKPTLAEDDFTFANEALPINDAGVNKRLQASLRTHSYKHIRSNILQTKAAALFPIIEPILKAHGIPDDFKYVPLVESGLCAGTSPKGARGLWQFMPGTARTYGLKVGKGVDERLNTSKSTIAACKYIKELYLEFNSWTLAAAAYNNGEIKLQKAIRRQNEDNYFLMHLNRETGGYVYNLIAMKQIISWPLKYGYKNSLNVLKPGQLLAFN